MIYLFNQKKEMVKMIPFRNIITAHQTKEVNGLYKFDMELPLFFRNNKGQFFNHKKNIDNAVFIGHFDDADKFQLYKIHARIVSNDNLIVSAVHIFFDEALAMDVIRDKRPTSIDAKTASEIAFGSTGWRVADYDTTDLKSTNFYYITPVEARKKIIETWNVEFDYGLTFDGQKIISKDLYIKKRLGSWTGKRFAYGSNLLSITDEQNEAEVVTAVIGRGKGEEVGDGYGRRIDFSDITWSKDDITKTAGKDYIEIPSATAKYGYYDDVTKTMKARIGVIVFDDIEDKTELANASYNWLLQNCVPKSVMHTTVAKIGGVKLGDDIGIIYQEVEIAKMARVQKMIIDLIDEHKSEITIGDYQYFKEDKATANLKRDIAQVKNEAEHYITQLKNEFDTGFATQTEIIEGKIAQVIQDAEADVLATETKMREEMAVMKRETDATLTQFHNNLLNYDTRINEIDGLVNKAVADASTAMNLSKQASDNLITTQQSLDAVKADVIKNSGDVASVKNSVAGQSAEISNLNNQIKLSATKTEIADAVGNIQIGGTNLFENSLNIFKRIDESFNNLTQMFRIDISHVSPKLKVGDVITISFDIQMETGAILRIYDSSGQIDKSFGIEIFTDIGTDKQRLSFTKTVVEPTKPTKKWYVDFYNNNDASNRFIIERIKIEKGNQATDYSIAPEDFNARITKNEADIVIANDAITQRVTKTEYDTKTNQMQSQINTAVSTAERNTQTITVLQGDIDNVESWQVQKGSVIDQTANAITNKVWNTDIDNATNTLTTKINTVQSTADSNKSSITTIQQSVNNLQTWQTQKGSVIDQTANAITNKVWQSDIDNLVFQNENLEYDSNFDKNALNGWGAGSYNRTVLNGVFTATSTATGDGTYIYKSISNLPTGRYTFSFSMKSSLAIKNFVLTSGLKFVSQSDLTASPNSFKTYSVTFDKTTASTTTETIFFYMLCAVVGSKVEIDWYKLENGSKATSWTPSVRELSSQVVSNSAEIEVNKQAITQRVLQTDYDAKTGALTTQINTVTQTADSNKALITSVKGTVDALDAWKTQKGSLIDQTINAVSTKVWQSDIDALSVGTRNLLLNSKIRSDIIGAKPAMYRYIRYVLSKPLEAYKTYTLTFKYRTLTGDTLNKITVRTWNQNYGTWLLNANQNELITHKFQVTTGGSKEILIYTGEMGTTSVGATDIEITEAMLIEGNKSGTWMPAPEDAENRMTEIQSTADAVKIQADAISKDYVKQSAVITTADGIQIGSKIIKGDTLASVISVTPSNVDIITRVMRVTGDMQVAGDIKSLSLSAVYADIASLRANIITADSIDATALKADLSMINKLFAQDAYVSALTSKTAFIRDIKAIDISADRITGGVLRSSNENVNWDLNTGVIYFKNPRNAMRYSVNGWTSGLHFSQDDSGYPASVVGTSKTYPDLDSNNPTFVGIKAIAEGSSVQVWGGTLALLSKASVTSTAETIWKMDIDQSPESPNGVRAIVGYKNAQLGRDGRRFDRVWTNNVNRMKFGTESIESENGMNGFYLNSSGSMLIKRNGKFYDFDTVLRASGFSV
ncbi:phage tail spike protein [Macrococcus armenti]|uniref:phage tail spike protein n=1 Tax=Macrococcus armenti TaxID=2875764 RepID=UPI001CD0375D|nr:phage tail spike protein [Macrococcus armenti]UBH16409.1 phage tail protein [Macrococcus armenti]UBH18765.1 phage tail protein [Macrococcus armenti]UBH21037.1 phage tail protein [Macrococcus armenti]